MKPTTSMSSYRLHRAIIQLIGEMQEMGQAVWATDVAQFLDVTKQTARKHLNRMIDNGFIIVILKPYKAHVPVAIYKLSPKGKKLLNTSTAKEAKNAILAMRGILV